MAGSPGTKQATAGPAAGNVIPAAFTLVHTVTGAKKALFAPTRLMNPVTYLGRTQGNDIVLGSDNVSRRHAKIVVTDAGVTVHDLDSHNGIFLNGKKVRSTPVNVGDLLYVGDVCIELKKSADAGVDVGGPRRTQHEEITGEEDPAIRSLATLLRATDLIAKGDDDAWAIQAIELCRELTEATVAVLISQDVGGLLETPVVLQPENNKRGEVPVVWPVVRKAIDDASPVFSADAKRDPPIKDDALTKSDVGAVMCVPIVGDASAGVSNAEGAIYLARPSPGQVFTERELEAVQAIASMFALRRRPAGGSSSKSDLDEGTTDVVLRAKAEAAEEKLREAQADMRSLTERVHGMEADALKLRQQIDLEKQNAVEAKREADRRIAESHKLEQGLHKTDEDAKKLKDALVRSEEERQKLRENAKQIDEDRKQKTAELERTKGELEKTKATLKEVEVERDQVREELAAKTRFGDETDDARKRAESEIERLTKELAEAKNETTSTRESFEKAVAEQAAAVDALKSAMRATIPPGLADHVESAAVEGKPLVTDVTTEPAAALFVTLVGFDSWALKASGDDVKRRLDHFCNSLALRARANGGRVQQVLGHAHLVVFPADAASVRSAVMCGLEVASLVPVEDGVGVASAVHVGSLSSGFFGEGDSATLVETGEALLIARGVAGLAHEPAFFATNAVHKIVADDAAFTFALAGPAAIVGGPTVVLYKVSSSTEGGAQ